MANEKENEILLIVKVDEEAVTKKIVDLRKEVIGLKNDKEELRKANKAGTISNQEYAEGITKTNLAINIANKGIRENEKTLENNTKQQKAAAGSLVQMRANLSLLTNDFINLSAEERKNAEVGGKLQKQIKDLSDELKKEEGAIGDNRRSVGGYAEAIEGAISGNTSWISSLRNTANNLKEGKESIGQYIQGLKGTTEGMGKVQKASFALGLGLKAIGIGLLLQAITGLIAFLSKMDAGMDKVEQATAALSAGFEAFIQTVAPIGELIVDAFTNPLESIKTFGKALLDPLGTLKRIATASSEMSKEAAANIGKAAAAAVEYTKTQQDLGDEQDSLIAKQAAVNAQIAKALISAKDRSKTERERIKLLDEAGKAEQALANQVVSIRQRELQNLIKFQAAKKELQDQDRVDLQKAQAAAINAQAESEQTEQQIQNRRSALLEQEASAREAAANKAKEQAKKAADERVAETERALIMAQRKGLDTLKIEEELVKRQLKADLIGVAKRSQQRLLLEAQANAKLLELNSKYAQELTNRNFETENSRLNAQLALVQRGTQRELDLQKNQLRARLDLDKAQAVETIKNKKQQTARLRELDATYNASVEQLDDAFAKGQLDRQADLNSKRLQTEIDLSRQTFAVLIDNQQKQINLEEKNALDLLQLEEDTARERLQLDERLQEELLVKRNAIQAKAIAARRTLAQQELEQERADAIALAEARLIATKEGSFKELQARKDVLKKRRDQEIAAAKENAAEIAKINAQFRKDEGKLDEDFAKQLADQILQTLSLATSGISTALEAQATAAMNALQKQQDAAVRSAGANADLRGRIEEQFQKKREALEKDAARKRKRIASAENIIQTAQAGTAALSLFAKNPILGALTELLILAKAAANQKLIDAQAFALGGAYFDSDGRGSYVRGPGTGKSDSINARISNGESIMNARSTEMFYPVLSALNVAGGGRAFPGAGGVPMPDLTGYAGGGLPQPQGGDLMQVVKAIQDLNIFVNVTEIDAVKSDMVKAKASGDY